jgi:hypothetical protein
VAALEDLLELAALTKRAVEDGEDNVRLDVQRGEIAGGDIELGDFMSRLSQCLGDAPPGDE